MKVEVIKEVDVPLEKIWAILSDFGNMSWAPGLEKVEVIGEGSGMIRRLTMPGMDPFDEILSWMDEDKKAFAYTIPEGIPLPVTDYSAGVKLEAIDSGHCRVIWTSDAKATGDVADAEAIVSGMYGQMVDWLVEHIKAN